MKKAIVYVAVIFLGIGILTGISISVSAEEGLIPSWIKNTAGFWVNDQISDSEFIAALQFLVGEGILVIPTTSQEEGISEGEQIITSGSETSKKESEEELITNANAFLVQSNPEKFKGRWAQFYGEIIWDPEIYDNDIAFALNLDQGDEESFNENFIWLGITNGDPLKYQHGTCLYAEGKFLNPWERTNMFEQKFIVAFMDVEKVTELSCLEAKYPTIKTVFVNESQESGNVRVTVEKIEFTDYHTRIYVEFENLSKSKDLEYYYRESKIIQDKTQLTATHSPFDLDIDDIETEIAPGTLEKGIIFFEQAELKSLSVVIESSRFSEEPKFTFNVDV